MNESKEIEIDLTDIHLDDENDVLQIVVGKKKTNEIKRKILFLRFISGPMSFNLNRPRLERFHCFNQTLIILRTKHTTTDEHYRGFHLTYRSKSLTRSLFHMIRSFLFNEQNSLITMIMIIMTLSMIPR